MPTLSRCPEYSTSSCCSEAEHERLDNDFKAIYDEVFQPCPECLENFRRLQCAIHCAPTQRDFVTLTEVEPQSGVVRSASVRLCSDWCGRFDAACANTTVRALFLPTGRGEFCKAQMDSARGITLDLQSTLCLEIDGPDRCDGGYDAASVDAAASAPTPQDVALLILFICLFLVGLLSIIRIWNSNDGSGPGAPPCGIRPFAPYSRQPIFVRGGRPDLAATADCRDRGGGAAAGAFGCDRAWPNRPVPAATDTCSRRRPPHTKLKAAFEQ